MRHTCNTEYYEWMTKNVTRWLWSVSLAFTEHVRIASIFSKKKIDHTLHNHLLVGDWDQKIKHIHVFSTTERWNGLIKTSWTNAQKWDNVFNQTTHWLFRSNDTNIYIYIRETTTPTSIANDINKVSLNKFAMVSMHRRLEKNRQCNVCIFWQNAWIMWRHNISTHLYTNASTS